MEESLIFDDFGTSSTYNDGYDVVIDHQEYFGTYYTYETGKSLVEICMDMGLDTDNIPFRLM